MTKFKMEFYSVYYFCNIASNVLNDIQFAATLDPFFCGFNYYESENFPKFSILHSYCEFIVREIISEDYRICSDISLATASKTSEVHLYNEISINSLLNKIKPNDWILFRAAKVYNKGIDFNSWFLNRCDVYESAEDALSDFLTEFSTDIDEITFNIAIEMFYILFSNREFLKNFNQYIAEGKKLKTERCYIPEWVKNAVFYRDKGKCVFCGKDLSGLLCVPDTKDKQYDHIVPLSEGGINDISNIQLSCSKCNEKKLTHTLTSKDYYYWYEY
jgi:hypothetical protein